MIFIQELFDSTDMLTQNGLVRGVVHIHHGRQK